MRGDGPIAGRRSSHVIPVMPRRAMFGSRGGTYPHERASFVHTEVCGRARHAPNAKTGPMSAPSRGEWSCVQLDSPDGRGCYAAPAMYRATRPHSRHCRVTCERGGGGKSSGVRAICPEHDGQLSGEPFRSLAIRWSACTGLYVAGRGLRIGPPESFRTHPEIQAPGRPDE